MTLAEKRLQVIADAAGKLATAVQIFVDNGQPLSHDLTEELAVWLDSLRVYATAADLEPQSFRIYDGLRIVQ